PMRHATGLVLSLVPLACCSAARSASEAKGGMERVKGREPFFPMLSDAQVRKAMPGTFDKRKIPNLIRVAALMPKSTQAELRAWETMGKEGKLDRRLLSELFYVVSSENDCFY
ncbi:MAG: hypothetical protein ACREID_04945, partial [Planctomycetota bacterium]